MLPPKCYLIGTGVWVRGGALISLAWCSGGFLSLPASLRRILFAYVYSWRPLNLRSLWSYPRGAQLVVLGSGFELKTAASPHAIELTPDC